MFKIYEVKKIGQSNHSDCTFIRYEDNGMLKYAACIDGLTVQRGNKVEIYSDDYVNYRGFSAIALRVIQEVGCVQKEVKDMDLFDKDSVQEISTDFDTQYVQDSLIQIWGRFLGYPVNYSDLNKIKDKWRAIYQYSKETFENASPNDFNTVIDFVVSVVDKEFGLYQSLIYNTITLHEVE